MNVTRKDVDALNAVITVDINQEDVAPKVEQVLNDYRKRADIPGFRKGNVPMGVIKKQYGQAVMVDEVNKMLQSSLNDFLNEEKISILGNPLPVPVDNIDWNATAFSFDFELNFLKFSYFNILKVDFISVILKKNIPLGQSPKIIPLLVFTFFN